MGVDTPNVADAVYMKREGRGTGSVMYETVYM